MKRNPKLSKGLVILGLSMLVLGAADPLDLCLLLMAGAIASLIGAWIGESRFLRWMAWAAGFMFVGFAAMWILTWMHGIGGSTGRSLWWGVTTLPFPIGWVLAVVISVLRLREEPPYRPEKPDENRPSPSGNGWPKAG